MAARYYHPASNCFVAAKRLSSSRHNMSALQAMWLVFICVTTEYTNNTYEWHYYDIIMLQWHVRKFVA